MYCVTFCTRGSEIQFSQAFKGPLNSCPSLVCHVFNHHLLCPTVPQTATPPPLSAKNARWGERQSIYIFLRLFPK